MSIFARVHETSRRMRITPAFKDSVSDVESNEDDGEDAHGRGGPVEQVEGSTARSVAAAVEMFSREILDMARTLQRLQKQLDDQQEGCADIASCVDMTRTAAAVQQRQMPLLWPQVWPHPVCASIL
jgi:hypothetical protein